MTSVPPRTLLVTGDDFGISAEVNRAIIEAHERGILTHASLMVTGEAFEEAVALARRASPLPPPPTDIAGGGSILLSVPVSFGD